MTEGEITGFVDCFVARAETHEECARRSESLDVQLFHHRLAAHYRQLAAETGQLRATIIAVESSPQARGF